MESADGATGADGEGPVTMSSRILVLSDPVIDKPPNEARGGFRVEVALVAASLLSGCALLWATRSGLGLTTDSMVYLGGARSLLHGTGFRDQGGDWISHYPPLYSLVVALLGRAGFNLLEASRWLNAVLLGVTTLFTGRLASRIDDSRLVAILAALSVGLSIAMLNVHRYFLSEPMFLALTVTSGAVLAESWRRGSARKLALGCLLVGLSYLTRYVGLVNIACCSFLLIAFAWQRRISLRAVAAGGAILMAGPIAFAGVALSHGGGMSDRTLGWHPVQAAQLTAAARAIGLWVGPGRLPSTLLVGLGAGVLGTLVAWGAVPRWRRSGGRGAGNWTSAEGIAFACALYTFAYLAAVVASICLFDSGTPLDERILSPVYVPLLLLAVFVATRERPTAGATALRRRRIRLVVLTIVAALSLGRGVKWMAQAGAYAPGFANRDWSRSETIAWLRSHAGGRPIVSNFPRLVSFVSNQSARWLPAAYDYTGRAPNPRLESELRQLRHDVSAGALVVFLEKHVPSRPLLVSRQQVLTVLSDFPVRQFEDGCVIGDDGPGPVGGEATR